MPPLAKEVKSLVKEIKKPNIVTSTVKKPNMVTSQNTNNVTSMLKTSVNKDPLGEYTKTIEAIIKDYEDKVKRSNIVVNKPLRKDAPKLIPSSQNQVKPAAEKKILIFANNRFVERKAYGPVVTKPTIAINSNVNVSAGNLVIKPAIVRNANVNVPAENLANKTAISRNVNLNVPVANLVNKTAIARNVNVNVSAGNLVTKPTVPINANLNVAVGKLTTKPVTGKNHLNKNLPDAFKGVAYQPVQVKQTNAYSKTIQDQENYYKQHFYTNDLRVNEPNNVYDYDNLNGKSSVPSYDDQSLIQSYMKIIEELDRQNRNILRNY